MKILKLTLFCLFSSASVAASSLTGSQPNTTTFPTFLSFSADIENVFQIWFTPAGYKELVGVFEPVKNEKYFG